MTTETRTLADLMAEHKITVDAVFVPWSKSRNAKPSTKVGDRSLNWRVTVRKDGRDVYATDYSAGIGHCPSYKQGRMTTDDALRIEHETETGRRALSIGALGVRPGAPILPEPADVFYSLLSDGDAIDHPTFESWASDLGYDVDSRKAETTYRECLAIGLALRSAFGDTLLTELRESAREM